MIIEQATKDDHQMLKDLWKEVFDEEEAFLERFFSTRIRYEHIFVAREKDRIVSALHALPSTYLQKGTEHDCSFIVGAATYASWRRKGLMGSLLQAVREAYSHPITLFPAVRPFYEANGYFTTSSLLQHPLGAMKKTSAQLEPIVFSELDRIHRKANEPRKLQLSCFACSQNAKSLQCKPFPPTPCLVSWKEKRQCPSRWG